MAPLKERPTMAAQAFVEGYSSRGQLASTVHQVLSNHPKYVVRF